jgi:hypothetical protein
MLEAGASIWIFYGVLREAPAIWIGNAVTLALVGFILSVKMRGGLVQERPQEMTSATVDECRL